ncbi:retrovirus-related Pol polyprotein from transposon TNT 1-94 isoform X1 [Gossypium australe]|uniref:Retrovirus-related Pol polyprotein from transposon TNT 1-94 isoform X1 n=1 Tax=Gossypium australe TaxID=47621 RepID=A0A5B6WGS0_9ROSI|nr:retrovirus-related Pol polyprotein from transposon TNT 1-94 isoform X1 [Gossypium australe]
MRIALRAKKKFRFIYGTIEQLDDDSSKLEDWWTVNSMLVSWMLNTTEPTLRSTITYMDISKDLWEDIKEQCSIANGPCIPICCCGKCNCNVAAELDKKREKERLHQFWIGLEDALYKAVCSNILSTDPLPNLNKAYLLVCQEERIKKISRKEEHVEVVSFAVQAKTGGLKYKTETRDK